MAMPDLHLYTTPLCPYAQRVRLALAEKGLGAHEQEIDPLDKPASFLTLSPDGKVPLLVHGQDRLTGSAAINEYLDRTFPEPPLLPRQDHRRAVARYWIRFADERIYSPTHDLLTTFDPDAQPVLAGALSDQLRFLETNAFAEHGGPYLSGEGFGLADIALFPWFEQVAVLERMRQFHMPADCPRIVSWLNAVAERPAIRRLTRDADFYLQGYAALAARMRRAEPVRHGAR